MSVGRLRKFVPTLAIAPMRILSAILILCLGGWQTIAAAPPNVARIEPPSWWIGHSVNPVRLLVTGTNLADVRVEAGPDAGVANLTSSTNGNYLFLDLSISQGAQPGDVTLRFINGSSEFSKNFRLLPPLTPAGCFAGFTTDDVIYLLMPDRFANGDTTNDQPAESATLLNRSKPRHYHGGDLQGVIDHLGYLKELGVTALWLTPWYDNANHLNKLEKYTRANQRATHGDPVTDYHGYGAVDFYAVEEHFGDLPKLQELVRTAQATGFKFIQDQVANHTGPYHPWVRNPPTPTWFNGSVESHLDNSWQTWTTAETNPPPDKLKSTLDGWFINILPDLNQNDSETARYLIQNSLWWIGLTGVDAVRQDTLPYVPRRYWSQWTSALKREHPQLTVLGEFFDGNAKLVSFFQGGRKQFDGVDSGVGTLFDFPLYYAIRDVFARGKSMTRLREVLAADTNYVNPQVLVTFLGLHDTPRFMSESASGAQGLKQAFTFLLTARGTPMIYYGDEIAMDGGGDPYNRADFPGGWPDDKRSGFTAAGRTRLEEDTRQHVRKLLALRRELAPLRRGEMVQLHGDSSTLAYARVIGDAGVIVAINQSSEAQSLSLKLPASLARPTVWLDRLANGPGQKVTAGVLTLKLAAQSGRLLTPQSATLAVDQSEP